MPKKKKSKLGIFNKFLILKQIIKTTWKSKLQLVTLLLLSAFCTTLITGSWISYNRLQSGSEFMNLPSSNFNGLISFSSNTPSTQIANQAFSLSLGRLYAKDNDANSSVPTTALYFDDTRIGREIKKIEPKDISLTYELNGNKITGIKNLAWKNSEKPLKFDITNKNVQGSIYGQLMLKASRTSNSILKNNYETAANKLYNTIFKAISIPKIEESIKSFLNSWLQSNPTNLSDSDPDSIKITEELLKKINFHENADSKTDFSIPSNQNVLENEPLLWNKIVKTGATDPRAGETSIGMNGQWMKIRRKFDNTYDNDIEKRNFENYHTYYENNIISDNYLDESKLYSHQIMEAAAALQNHSIKVINQFTTTAGVNKNNNKTINAKIVKLGLKSNYNNVDLKILAGVAPISRDQIVISPQYAHMHKIKPGDYISINQLNFMVTGIGGDALNIYPRINVTDTIPNAENEYIAYVLRDLYYDYKWIDIEYRTDNTLVYFLPWKNLPVNNFDGQFFDDYYQRNLFSNNGSVDNFQYEYNKYLINKYVNKTSDNSNLALQNFRISTNRVINSNNGQFQAYSGGRNVFFKFKTTFLYIMTSAIIFLSAIIIFITFLIVKKAVQNNQVSMGILKASGYRTINIACSYIAYALLALFIALPIGWIAGVASQYYFTAIFNSLFILPYNVFTVSLWPLLASIVLIIGCICLTAIGAAFTILQKKTLLLIKKDSDISIGNGKHSILQRIFEKNFKAKFVFSLTKNSWKKITITSTVIGIATLAISTSVAIPASINKIDTEYFKTQKYQNYYKYHSPTPNMPLSKYALSSWTNLDNSLNEDLYPVKGIMPFPEAIIIKDRDNKKIAWYNPIDYKKNEKDFNSIVNFYNQAETDERKKEVINKLDNQFQNDIFGPINVDLLTWNFTWLGGRGFSNRMISEFKKLDNSSNKQFTNDLIKLVVNLLPGFLSLPKTDVNNENSIIAILKTILPGYARQTLDKIQEEKKRTGDNNYDAYANFSIGHNSVAINPTYDEKINGPQEELVTQVNLAPADAKLNSKGFMDILGINPETKMLQIDNNLVDNLKFEQNQKVIPLIVNKAFSARYKLYQGSQFNAYPSVNTLHYLNKYGDYVPMPKENWYYGDENDTNFGEVTSGENIWSTTANKWNYYGDKPLFDNGDYKQTFGYSYNGDYLTEGKETKKIFSEQPKEWNDINKIWLKLPNDIDSRAESGEIKGDKESNGIFNIKNIAATKTDEKWIKPFSFKTTNFWSNKDPGAIDILTKKIPEWYGGMIDKEILKNKLNIEEDNVNKGISNINNWWKNVNGNSEPVTTYKVIGIQNSYDVPRAFIDQKWANRISGYTNSDLKDPKTLGNQYQWFNGKLSAADNIYDLIARYSIRYVSDDYTLYGADITKHGKNVSVPVVQSFDLLSKKREILSKMSEIAFLISALFILITILCSILIVIMITDSFTSQFRRFMALMKSEGYKNWEINSFTIGIFAPWSLLGYGAGYGLGYLLFFALLKAISITTGLVLPFAFIWWILPFSFFLISSIYVTTLIINNFQLNKMNLLELLKTDE